MENGVFNGGFFSGSPLLASFGIFLLDYIIAFTVLGFGGIFRNKIKNKQLSLVCGILTAGLFRYIAHVISGAIFFGIWGEWFFTQEGFFAWGQTLVDMFPGQSLYVIYSLIYNLSFLLPEVVITAVVGFLITKAMPRLLDKRTCSKNLSGQFCSDSCISKDGLYIWLTKNRKDFSLPVFAFQLFCRR